MSLSSRGMIAARAMETRSLHPWCVQVSGEAALIPALGTLADLLLHLYPQLHLGKTDIYIHSKFNFLAVFS